MKMHSYQIELIETALKSIVKDGGVKSWSQLKTKLVARGLMEQLVEDHHADIVDMLLLINESQVAYRPSANSNAPPLAVSGQLRLPPQMESATTIIPGKQEMGWIQLIGRTERAEFTFVFGSKKRNIVGKHIIDRYKKIWKDLESQIQNDTVEFVCGLSSNSARTYDVKFCIMESKDYDIQLGVYWKGDKPKRKKSGVRRPVELADDPKTKTLGGNQGKSF